MILENMYEERKKERKKKEKKIAKQQRQAVLLFLSLGKGST